jgi:hypothetical protein
MAMNALTLSYRHPEHITQFAHGFFCCFLIGGGKAHQQAPLHRAVTVLD